MESAPAMEVVLWGGMRPAARALQAGRPALLAGARVASRSRHRHFDNANQHVQFELSNTGDQAVVPYRYLDQEGRAVVGLGVIEDGQPFAVAEAACGYFATFARAAVH
eukprot:4139019-Alexandrium_andersonii.AAC.1